MMTDASKKVINNTIEDEEKIATIHMKETKSEDDEITLEDLAPDGGWGWMIALAMIIILITITGPSSSFAIIFGDFLEESKQAGTASSIFNSVFMVTFSVASMLTNMLLKRFSARLVGIVGALLFAMSGIILAFVRNIYDMAVLFFFEGFGLGLVFTVCNTIFNMYFVKKRAKVMSSLQVIVALGGIIYPILIEKMMKLYGFRGTSAIIGALSLNSVLGMLLMHPVEWHARKPEEVRAERARKKKQKFQESSMSNRRATIDGIHMSSRTNNKWSSLRSLKEESDKEVPLLNETFKSTAHRVASISVIESSAGERTRSGFLRENLARRVSALSTSSLANLVASVGAIDELRQRHLEKRNTEKQEPDKEIQQEKQEKEIQDTNGEQEQTECKKILKELLDMSLIKNWCFMNLCFGISFVCTGDYAFSSFLPLIMTDAGYTKSNAALTVTISGIAELTSKVLLAFFTMIVNSKAKYLFFVATILMQFARIGFLLCEHTLVGVFIMTAIIGVVRSWLLVPQPLVIIEDISVEKFASAYGISTVISGLVTIVCGAIVGVIKDWTNSYEMYQISLLVLNGAFIIPWALQFIFVDLKKWRMQRSREHYNTIY